MTALDNALHAAGRTTSESDPDRRAEIYRNAARIFHRKGYHATSINDIAAAVGLTKAGLYYYIKGKQDLLFAIMSFAMDQLDEQVIEPARRHEDPETRLHTIVACHARLITQDSSAADHSRQRARRAAARRPDRHHRQAAGLRRVHRRHPRRPA